MIDVTPVKYYFMQVVASGVRVRLKAYMTPQLPVLSHFLPLYRPRIYLHFCV